MKRLLYLPAIAGMLLLCFAGCRNADTGKPGPAQNPSTPKSAMKQSHPAPDFSLKDLSGKQVHLSDFKGQVIVMDFWATWCPPCRQEIPHLVDFYHRYKDKGVVIVGVSVDEDGVKAVKPFVEEHKIDYPILLADDAVQNAYGPIEGIPTKVIIDKNGNIVARLVGYQEISTLEKKILLLL